MGVRTPPPLKNYNVISFLKLLVRTHLKITSQANIHAQLLREAIDDDDDGDDDDDECFACGPIMSIFMMGIIGPPAKRFPHESMGPGRDRTRDPWICSQIRICSQTSNRLRYVNLIMVYSYGFLLNCTKVGQASDQGTALV